MDKSYDMSNLIVVFSPFYSVDEFKRYHYLGQWNNIISILLFFLNRWCKLRRLARHSISSLKVCSCWIYNYLRILSSKTKVEFLVVDVHNTRNLNSNNRLHIDSVAVKSRNESELGWFRNRCAFKLLALKEFHLKNVSYLQLLFEALLPRPHCSALNVFIINWKVLQWYAFPPFSLILRLTVKVKRDQADLILIVPPWPSQAWFPILLQHSAHFQTGRLFYPPVQNGATPLLQSDRFLHSQPSSGGNPE